MNHIEVLMEHKYMQNSLTQALTTLNGAQALARQHVVACALVFLWCIRTDKELQVLLLQIFEGKSL